MSKQFLAILAVVILGLFGVLFFTKDHNNKTNSSTNSPTAQATNHVMGPENSNVTLVEYGDFQCPACGAYFSVVEQLNKDYADKVKFQFRHFPLVSIHPNAFRGSRAAEAAGKQGKFFEMYALLYQQQDAWTQATDPTETFVSYANQLNLDTEQFKKDLDSAEVAAAINADLDAGKQLGINSTPTFVLNGRKLDQTPRTLEEFKKVIDEEIAKVNNGQ